MIESILRRGILVTVVVMMILILGIVAATRVPVQMIPDLDTRIISVGTHWPGATPQDIEKEILVEQEDYLRGIPNLKRMTSFASTGRAEIELEFPFGIDANEALLLVNNALSQVPSYPENVDEPVLSSDSFSYSPFLSFRIVPMPGNPQGHDVNALLDFVDDNIRPTLERIDGVSQVRLGGGAERQIRIRVDAAKLAERHLTLGEVRDAIRNRNLDVSGGDLDSGKRRYLLRIVGRFERVADLEDLILVRRGDAIVRLGDVATVDLALAELRNLSYSDGDANIRVSLVRQTGSNVITIKQAALPVMERLNRDLLAPEGLRMEVSNDDVVYVEESIANVVQNILLGAILSTLVLFIYLRSVSTTLIGISGMPVCIVAGFIGLLLLDRTINVISMAGIAFAIGMTIDNTIVVLESIEIERQKGKSRFAAALDGVRNVWTAVLASTLTTVLVFLPLLFVKEEAGQLFSDIGIAISASILVSMLVAVTIVPVAYANLPVRLGGGEPRPPRRQRLLVPIGWLLAKPWRRGLCLVATLLFSLGAFAYLTPPAEYLPEGEEAKSFSTLIAPPGYSLREMDAIALELQEETLPALEGDPADFDAGRDTIPALSRLTYIVEPETMRVIAVTKNPAHIDAFIEWMNTRLKRYPGMRAFSSRGSIISSNDGGTRAVALDIGGPDMPALYAAATEVYRRVGQVIEDAQINSAPSSLVLGQPLLEIRPRWERLEELGFGTRDFGFAIAALSDGAFVDEFYLDDDKIDIFLFDEAGDRQDLAKLDSLPIFTPQGTTMPLGALAEIRETVDTAEIRRVDGRRTVTLYVVPPRSLPLETAVERVREEVVRPLRDEGLLPPGTGIELTGASDQLEATRLSLSQNLWIAVVLCYLQLVVIYRHWGFPFLILLTVPLGIGGGIVGLWLLNYFGAMLPALGLAPIRQPFDMITMLGFLVLLGAVVNNPILIVERSVQNFKEGGLAPLEAVRDAVQSRLRPILMTTATTLFGLAPLVFRPGAGTELYRGLGAIVLFGLGFTTIITLTFLPSLLVTVLETIRRFRRLPA